EFPKRHESSWVATQIDASSREKHNSIESGEDLCILYSNRAACYLKDGSNTECIQDCTRALDIQPFSLKPLLRRATAYESMERYRQAYVDFKTVLQIDIGVQAAHDSVHRITKQLIEQDGPDWRQKLPEIPLVPLSAQQHHRQKDPSAELVQAREGQRSLPVYWLATSLPARFASLKTEGNEHVRKSQFHDGLEKYSECLKIKPDECSCFTNRAICYLRLGCFEEARQDCDSALKLEPTNKKAFYRRALAFKEQGKPMNTVFSKNRKTACFLLTQQIKQLTCGCGYMWNAFYWPNAQPILPVPSK
uniref:Sperm associated antigen 1 n=1 Tax=Oncorhynchus mykiss TaxID=8022 RepID=A0A8K9X194_ONCMY